MKDFLDKRLEIMRAQMKISSVYGGKHTTTVADLREANFRSFITDIFPYYDAFKGNVNGKSCDFILANNQDHPRYNSVPNLYPHVVMSAIDTVIDLKGKSTPKQFSEGVDQSSKVKEINRSLNGTTGMTQEYKNLMDYWTRLTARHGLVFIEGNNKNILKKIAKEIGGINRKHILTDSNGIPTGKTVEDPVKTINKEELITLYRMPDFYYSISTNELIYIDKNHIFNSGPYGNTIYDISIYSIDNENALYIFTYLLEKFSNERDTSKMRKHFHLELKDNLSAASQGLFYRVTPDLKWLLETRTNTWNITPFEENKIKEFLGLI